jgi:hypothetical protein
MAVSQVLFLRAQTMPISHSRCNHMTIGHEDRSIRLVHFPQDGAPTKFGLLARGVYPFHFSCFQKNSSLWHFQGTRSISMMDLAQFPRRQLKTKICCPPLQMARTLRASQHRASLDFPQLMM